MSFDRFRLVGWILPGFCLAASAGIMLNRHSALSTAGREEGMAGAKLESARAAVAAAKQKPKDARVACAPRSTNEETTFLMDLRRRAHVSGVSIARWNSHATDYKKKEGVSTPETDAVEGVTKVSCDLVLVGTYPALRAFLTDLNGSARLITVSHVDWNRSDAGSELSMSLGRYLAPLSPASSTEAAKS